MPASRPIFTPSRRVGLFVLISLGLHGAGLLAYSKFQFQPPVSLVDRGPVLTLQWLGPHLSAQAAADPPPQPPPSQQTDHPQETEPTVAAPSPAPQPSETAAAAAPPLATPAAAPTQPETPSGPTPIQAAPATANTPPPPGQHAPATTEPAPSLATARQALRLLLANTIERKYPRLARKRGWEGEVLLEFRIDRQGYIGDIHIARSSGYPLLDRSALKSLSRVKRVALSSFELNQDIEMDLAIRYRLEEI